MSRAWKVRPRRAAITALTSGLPARVGTAPQSGPVAVEGRGSAVLEHSAGRWVIVQRHTSARRKASP